MVWDVATVVEQFTTHKQHTHTHTFNEEISEQYKSTHDCHDCLSRSPRDADVVVVVVVGGDARET